MKTERRLFLAIATLAFLTFGNEAAGRTEARPQAAASDARLDRILAMTKEYCRRLESAALDFVCVEDIKEEIFRIPQPGDDATISDQMGILLTPSRPSHKIVRSFVHDYQFVRKGDRRVENRTLVKEDGIPRNEPNASLSTITVRVENALFGPVGLLGKAKQPEFEYAIASETTDKGKKVFLVDAVPKPAYAGVRCNGRIWILEEDASIVRIEWEQTSVGNFQAILETARVLNAEPSLVSVTEYDVVKNGIRFPGRDTTEEAYLLKTGKKFVRSKTTILYKDYKFFTVETDVKF